LSAYPNEEEILLQDGIEYLVVECVQAIETFEEDSQVYKKSVTRVVLEKKVDKYSSMNCLFRSMKLLID